MERCADVVLIVGPSGCGKTFVAQQSGLPIMALDDFYRPDTDPSAPLGPDGLVDWEDPRSWNLKDAVTALEALCCHDRVIVPDYSFAQNRAIGTKVIERHGVATVLAEGIFAAELIEPLREMGLLRDALLIHQNRWLTFARRLIRDVREGRKSPWFLVRQGWAKTAAEPKVVAHQLAMGARPTRKRDALAMLEDLAQAEPAKI